MRSHRTRIGTWVQVVVALTLGLSIMPNGERYRERDESPQETLDRYRAPELDE